MTLKKVSFRKYIKTFVEHWPGYNYIGHFSLLPLFFIGGAALEFAMIKWEPNGHNFYKTFKRTQAEERAKYLFQEYLKSEQQHQD